MGGQAAIEWLELRSTSELAWRLMQSKLFSVAGARVLDRALFAFSLFPHLAGLQSEIRSQIQMVNSCKKLCAWLTKREQAFSGQYLETYEGHTMAVYSVRWNPLLGSDRRQQCWRVGRLRSKFCSLFLQIGKLLNSEQPETEPSLSRLARQSRFNLSPKQVPREDIHLGIR